MWCLVAFQHDFHGQYPPQVKEKLFLNDILCLKGRSYLRSCPLARSKYYGAITKRMNFNCPVAETNESIEPNDNNLELNAVAYTFSKINSNPNFNSSFGDLELLASVSLVSPQRRTRKLKKKYHFLCCGRFHSIAVAFRNTKTRREGETKGPIDNEASLFWKSIVKNKTSKPD